MCIHLFLPKIHVFSTRPTFHFQKHQLPTTYGMVHWRRATGDGRRRSTAHHATPLPRHNSTGESKTNFEWDRWLSVGCQAGPSTPCIPLIVGSRCRGNSRQAAEVQRAGSLPRSSSVMRARRYTQENVNYAY